MSKVLKLNGVYYEWDRDKYPSMNFGEGKQVGFIAQEVEKILPELVSTDKEGYKGISYDRFSAFLVEALKELKQEKDLEDERQKTRDKGLEAENIRLEAEINVLKEQLRELAGLIEVLNLEINELKKR